MVHARNKGGRGEREFCDILTRGLPGLVNKFGLPLVISRNLDQVRDGGADIMSLPPFAIEVKRHETLQLNPWWKQTLSQRTPTHPIPVLAWRKTRQPWRIRMLSIHICEEELSGPGYLTVDISLEHFIYIVRKLYSPG